MGRAGFVILTFVFRREGKTWTAVCQELGTATYARTLDQAHRELEELVEMHLSGLERHGERERFFRENDIRFYSDDAVPSEVSPTIPLGDDGSYVHPHKVAIGAA